MTLAPSGVALPEVVPALLAAQAATPTPGVGPDELAEYWPIITRAAWFLGGFVVTVLMGWFLVVPTVRRVVRRRNRNNPTIQEAVPRYARLLVLLVAFFVGAGTAGYGGFLSNSALIVAAGTLAVGVAAQTVVGSLVSGLVLVNDPEINVGDYIEWSEGAGTIETITLRVTRLVTEDGERVTVPNTTLTGETITRPYGRNRHRVATEIGLSYEADLAEATDHLARVARDLPEVAREPSPAAHVEEFADDAVVVVVRYWVENPRPREIAGARSAYARAAKCRLEAAGIDISPASEHELGGHLSVDDASGATDRGTSR